METAQRILFVDDEAAMGFSYKKLLRGADVKVDDCMTLDDALGMIRDNSYNAIITDLRLSHSEGNEGLEILQYVKVHKPGTPVILLTAYGSSEIRETALTLGACGYFDKPVQISKIISLLRGMGIHAGES